MIRLVSGRRLVGASPLAGSFAAFWVALVLLRIFDDGLMRPVETSAELAGILLLISRVTVMGAWRGQGSIVIRSWFRTLRLSSEAVTAFESERYSGFANRFSESHMFHMVAAVHSDGSRTALRFTVARRRRVHLIVAGLNRTV